MTTQTRLMILSNARRVLESQLAAAETALTNARNARQRTGTMQTGATKAAYQRADIRYEAACKSFTAAGDRLAACVEWIAEIQEAME